MEIILVDTSVWINFFKGIETNASKFLKNNAANIIMATCPTIIQEILQGVVSDHDKNVVKLKFDSLTKLIEDPYEAAVEAAELYRSLRRIGITIRKPNDCLIAIYAIKNKVAILNDDRDFQFIADHSALRLVSL